MNSKHIHLEASCIPVAIWHRLETQNASLRGQLKGLHRARRTRECELEEKIASLEKKIGRLPKFTP